mmetsp:Transcript_26224/g.30935  ORF Transcript_26224/g.30935 Transcript_26224/m.30935 type:complete len:147 (-) Transcript_26224:412-852(-)|eukprot:CAMPEP_0198258564 /NCGR_PEP_ID=MMETSP1447-20131203/7944_1 /TAXON_ID=420782 /ORGANISM="Chaetoceros dichaeta, Strain CCMP1751" /LENGTH=146 /DNA_ID=CAMNT_0043945707 /DNA_START=49 /DNA_END=489 /DNA_ORIENTATION=+
MALSTVTSRLTNFRHLYPKAISAYSTCLLQPTETNIGSGSINGHDLNRMIVVRPYTVTADDSSTNTTLLHYDHTPTSIGTTIGAVWTSFSGQMWDTLSTWLIKRTYQPSIIRKRRKTGFLTRQKSVGGRRVLKRRQMKGRIRLGGC